MQQYIIHELITNTVTVNITLHEPTAYNQLLVNIAEQKKKKHSAADTEREPSIPSVPN